MTLQSRPSPLPRKDWSYDQYFLAQMKKTKKKDKDKNNKALQSN